MALSSRPYCRRWPRPKPVRIVTKISAQRAPGECPAPASRLAAQLFDRGPSRTDVRRLFLIYLTRSPVGSAMHVVTNPARVTRRQLESLCSVGMVLGASFFAASLTPTLIPRSYLTQGVLEGPALPSVTLSASSWVGCGAMPKCPPPRRAFEQRPTHWSRSPALSWSSGFCGEPQPGKTRFAP